MKIAVLLLCAVALSLAQNFCIEPELDIVHSLPGPELIQNGRFDNYGTYPWFSSDAEGFTIQAFVPGACGNFSAQIDTHASRSGCLRPYAGLYQKVQLSQNKTRRVFVSGYGRGDDVSGVADINFSLYVDVYFMDGTTHYGVYAPFPINSGYNRVSVTINETKPINYIFVNLLFRTHTGRAYFNLISAKEEIINNYPTGKNILSDPGFESCGASGSWTQEGGATCKIQYCGNKIVRNGNASLSTGSQSQDSCFTQIKQVIYFDPALTKTITFSAFVEIDYTPSSPTTGYVGLTITDNEYQVNITDVPFAATKGFKKVSVALTPNKPTPALQVLLLIQGKAGGITWDDASLIISA